MKLTVKIIASIIAVGWTWVATFLALERFIKIKWLLTIATMLVVAIVVISIAICDDEPEDD